MELAADETERPQRARIRSVDFDHDGTKIVSGPDDKAFQVWDAGARADPSQLQPNK